MRQQVASSSLLTALVAVSVLLTGCPAEVYVGDPGDTICGAGTVFNGTTCVPNSNDMAGGGGTDAGGTDTGGGDTAGGDTAGGDTGATDTGGGDTGTTDTGGTCTPNCAGRNCGDDGCGGQCGTCAAGTPYCHEGQCVAECVPSCGGKQCGDDGCGGKCGECDGGGSCNAKGLCIAAGWTCDANAYSGDGVCDCKCGVPDPDCLLAGLEVKNCAAGELCPAGDCVPGMPAGWVCAPELYADGQTCDCACGAPDPDCSNKNLPVLNCDSFLCNVDGTCGKCVPDCTDNECGSDGCGGVCGVCKDAAKGVCQKNKCVEACVPQCEDKTCGGDGCGGVCGTCKETETCTLHHCQALPPVLSCKSENACGKVTTGGCSCEPDCIVGLSCCADKVSACGCTPVCAGKNCGEDGCGGSCGSCAGDAVCNAAGYCVTDPCKPDPCNGKGVCSGGTCTCVTGFGGAGCGVCATGYTGFPDCKPDLCFAVNCGGKGTCDGKTGACVCDKDFVGPNCTSCSDSKKVYPDCDKPLPPCFGKTCGGQGVCDAVKDACVCAAGFKGENCEACEDVGKTWPKCSASPDQCGLACNNKGKCISENSCVCDPGFTGDNCEFCIDAGKTWPDCGNAASGNYGLDPALGGVTCDFCGVPLDKAPFTADPSDQTPPQLKVLIPPADGVIAPGMPIIAVVDDILDPATITPTTFRIHPEANAQAVIGGTIVRQVTVTNSTVLVFFPNNLQTGGKYKIVIDGVKDKGGVPLDKVDSPFVLGSGASGSLNGNTSFESNISGCFFAGDVAVNAGSENMTPSAGKMHLAMSSANGPMVSDNQAGSLAGQASIVYCGPLDIPGGKTQIRFDYNFASAEFDEYVGDQFDDIAFAAVSNAKGGTGGVVTSVNIVGKTGTLTKAYGLPGEGDDVAKMSGWKKATVSGIDAFGKDLFLTFAVADVADTAFTSILTIDNIEFAGNDPVCGNAVLEGDEECDDKNAADGDGCTKDCKIEPGYACSSSVDLNTGSTGQGAQAAAGTPDIRWETAIGLDWGAEGAAGDAKAIQKTPQVPPTGLAWQKANVMQPCVGSWAQPDPKKAAQWISTEGWDTATKTCKNPKSCSTGQLYYYRTKFSLPNEKTAAVTSLKGKLWADNQITRVWINGKKVSEFVEPAPGASTFTGPGVDFSGWKGYFQAGENELVFAVANFTSPQCPNPQGLVVAVDLAEGSVCEKACGSFGEACCPGAAGAAGTCAAPFQCDGSSSTCKCATGGVACGDACCGAGEYCKAGKCEDPAKQDCLSIFKPGASVINAACEAAGNCPASCKDILAADSGAQSGLYLVRPDTTKPVFQVQCDMAIDGGGWTLVGFEPAGNPNPANTTGVMANLTVESASVDTTALASATTAGFIGPRFAYKDRYTEGRLTWCTAAKAYRYQKFTASADLFANTVANKAVTAQGSNGEMIPLSSFTSNDADLNAQLTGPNDAAFCRAYAGALVPGDTSWAVKQKGESSNVCGCNSKGWQGTGSYYGGKGGGGNNDGCSSWGGGWSGTAGNGVKKGGVNSNTTFFWIR
ncbi:MAG: hypothetical protein H6747_16565 [Deltaproteobacteria bacterium]|nr:hypothetical protein [Deltaproteobacteria bacterium]